MHSAGRLCKNLSARTQLTFSCCAELESDSQSQSFASKQASKQERYIPSQSVTLQMFPVASQQKATSGSSFFAPAPAWCSVSRVASLAMHHHAHCTPTVQL